MTNGGNGIHNSCLSASMEAVHLASSITQSTFSTSYMRIVCIVHALVQLYNSSTSGVAICEEKINTQSSVCTLFHTVTDER
jgi:hypothetical protein